MPTTKELREKKGELIAAIRELADRQSEWTAEDRQNWESVNNDYNALQEQIERAEEAESVAHRLEEIEAESIQPAGGAQRAAETHDAFQSAAPPPEQHPNDQDLALRAWCQAQCGLAVDEEHRAAAQRVGVNLGVRELEIPLMRGETYQRFVAERRWQRREYRDLTTQTDATGGYLIAQSFGQWLEESLLAYGGVRRVATIFRTDTGADLPWPTVDDTSNTGELLTENTAVAEADPSFGVVEFKAYKFSSKLVQVPVELLQDSAFDLAAYLGRALGTRLGRIENSMFTTGTGTSQPKGIVTAAGTGVTAASTTAITADETLELVHSVDPAYRESPGVGFMMHDNILLVLRKLKDSNNNYLWQAGMQEGEPDRLWNYPLTINQQMASSVAASAKTIAFGDLSKYMIRDVASIRLRRLVERYAEYDQEGFVAFIRSDGNLLDAGTDPVKLLVQAAS